MKKRKIIRELEDRVEELEIEAQARELELEALERARDLEHERYQAAQRAAVLLRTALESEKKQGEAERNGHAATIAALEAKLYGSENGLLRKAVDESRTEIASLYKRIKGLEEDKKRIEAYAIFRSGSNEVSSEPTNAQSAEDEPSRKCLELRLELTRARNMIETLRVSEQRAYESLEEERQAYARDRAGWHEELGKLKKEKAELEAELRKIEQSNKK